MNSTNIAHSAWSKVKAFTWGIREFRLGCTRHYDYPLIESYDWGRECAHRLTLRRYEP